MIGHPSYNLAIGTHIPHDLPKPRPNKTPGIGALPILRVLKTNSVRPQCHFPSLPTTRISVSCMPDMRPSLAKLQLFLHHLRTVVFCRITHHFVFVHRRLAVSVCVRRAVSSAFPASFDEDMSLFVQSVRISRKFYCLQLLQNRIG